LKKRLVPTVLLVGGALLLTACASTASDGEPTPIAPLPNDTVIVATPPPQIPSMPEPNPTGNPTEVTPPQQEVAVVQPEENELVDTTGFIPMERGTWIWDFYYNATEIMANPATGEIFVDGVLASIQDRDYAGSPAHNQPPVTDPGVIQEPTWTTPSGNFHASLMNVGRHPAEWAERNVSITPLSFNEAMVAHNTNMRSNLTGAQLAQVEFVGHNARGMSWNNGVVTVLLQRLQDPEPGVWGRMSLEVWFTDERDPQTGALSDSIIQVFHSDDMNAVWQLHAGGSEFGVEFARQLWDALALLDQADSYADIEAARRVFE